MHKISKFRIALICGGLVLTTCAANAFHRKEEKALCAHPVVFSSLEGVQWAKSCVAQYPEILWLADKETRVTEEGQANPTANAYSEQLFNHKHIEFDRTLMTLRCLQLVLDGGDAAYTAFTQVQSEKYRLSRESFDTLHLQGTQLLESRWGGLSRTEMAQAMETALILGDMGKSARARELFASHGPQAPDHDDFHGEAMEVLARAPSLCPSFASLPQKSKELLLKTANLAHFGHMTHLEGGPDILQPLADSKIASSDPTALSFALFVHLCDVAGALGHVNKDSSVTYTQLTHKAVQATIDSVKTLGSPAQTAEGAYAHYVAKRAQWIGLDPSDPANRVLARIAAMLRLFTPEEGATLREGIQKLDDITRAQIVTCLDAQEGHHLGRTPTYMPAVLVNLAGNPHIGLSQAITLGLPFLAKVLEKHQDMLQKAEADPLVPLNFNPMAGVAKSNPELLQGEFKILSDGRVLPNNA